MSKFTFSHLIGRKAKTTEKDDDKANKAKNPPDEEAKDDEECHDTEENDSENAKDDSENTENDEDNQDVKKGRHAERQRCARIFGSNAAATRPDIAAHLAFNTNLSSTMAISTLKAMENSLTSQNNRRSLDARMREEEHVRLGQDVDVMPKDQTAVIIQKMTNLYNSNKGNK